VRRFIMYGKDRIYKKVEIIGVAAGSIEAAIETALLKAQGALDKLSWFEVQDIRGHIGPDGKVTEYQVVLKVSYELKG
jgi:flavin-binding protein dodecin